MPLLLPRQFSDIIEYRELLRFVISQISPKRRARFGVPMVLRQGGIPERGFLTGFTGVLGRKSRRISCTQHRP
jgi:hypothetical protein